MLYFAYGRFGEGWCPHVRSGLSLAWEPGDGVRYELVDGEPRAMAPASPVPGLLQGRLATLITDHPDRNKRACSLVVAPGVIPQMLSAHNVREPDLGVTCSPVRLGQATLPDPVLLIEILSPSNQADTWSNVWAYTSIPSVQEILVLHSERVFAEVLRRSAQGAWPEQTEEMPRGDLTLTSIDFRTPLADLYAGTGVAD